MAALHWLCSAPGHTEDSERIYEELVSALDKKDILISGCSHPPPLSPSLSSLPCLLSVSLSFPPASASLLPSNRWPNRSSLKLHASYMPVEVRWWKKRHFHEGRVCSGQVP